MKLKESKYPLEEIEEFVRYVIRRSIARSSQAMQAMKNKRDIRNYLSHGRLPWSQGYLLYKSGYIQSILSNGALMKKFRDAQELPEDFGSRLDERVVEYPWVISRLKDGKCRLLDAGSCFNYTEIINHPKVRAKDLTIFTLAPERNCFWKAGISYHFGDLRELPFQDNWFDEVCSISTLGHVGMDNRMYTKLETDVKIGLEADQATKELIRVLRPEGKLMASVVFGKHQIIEWDGTAFAEQFDSLLLENLLRAFSSCSYISVSFYKYTEKGWNISTEEECQGLEYFNINTAKSFDPDYAAAARAVALIEAVK